MIRLETKSRYYLCAVQQDLFGSWEVFRAWGGKGSRLGNSLRRPAHDEAHARELLARVVKERVANGYVVVAMP
jgi:predicted DNA-binding WGR domain protein